MERPPPRSPRPDPPLPYPTLFRSHSPRAFGLSGRAADDPPATTGARAYRGGGSLRRLVLAFHGVEKALRPLVPIVRHPDFALHASRSEEHTSELQSLMRISYAVFCLKKKTI